MVWLHAELPYIVLISLNGTETNRCYPHALPRLWYGLVVVARSARFNWPNLKEGGNSLLVLLIGHSEVPFSFQTKSPAKPARLKFRGVNGDDRQP